MYHDTSRQQQAVDWTKGQYGAYSIQGQVQQQKLEQMQRENDASKKFWDDHNKKMQDAWNPTPTTSSQPNIGSSHSSSSGGGGWIVALVIGVFLILAFLGG